MRFHYLIFLLAIFFSSCEKEKLGKTSSLVGEFEYAYSYSEYLGYSDFLEEGKIGIRIKSNGKIFVFRNGKLADKGRYVYSEPIGNSIVYHFNVEEEDLKFELIDGFLVSKEFPEQYSDNFFKSTGE